MNYVIRISTFFLCIIIFYSCEKSESNYTPIVFCSNFTRDVDSIKLFLNGKWNWVEDKVLHADGSVSYFTPQSQEYEESFSISGDTILFYKNGFSSIYKFKLLPESTITQWPQDTNTCLVLYSIATMDYYNYYPIKMCKDQLLLEQTYRSHIKPDRIFHKVF